MKIKKGIVFFLGIIFATNIFAEEPVNFLNVCKLISNVKFARGDFEVLMRKPKSKKTLEEYDFKSSGNYTLSADEGVIWFTTEPVKNIMVMKSTKIIVEMNGKAKVIDGEKNQTFIDFAKITSSVFTGNYETINEKFNIEYSIEKKEIDVSLEFNWSAKLTPKDKTVETFLKEIIIEGDCNTKNAQITKLAMIQTNGGSSVYMLKNRVEIDSLNENESKYFTK